MPTLIVTVPEAGPGLAQTLSSVAGQDVRGLFDEVLVALQDAAAGLTHKGGN